MTDTSLTQAELFDVFSNARRRRTVRFLKCQNGSCDLAPLVEQVAAWENDTDPNEVTRTQRRRVYISLYQTHLPMLEDHGIVEWDADGHEIELLPSEGTFEPYLDRHVDSQRSWHLMYASLAVAGVFALALAWLSIGPLSVAVAPFVAFALSGAIFFVATIQRASRQPGRGLSIPFPRR